MNKIFINKDNISLIESDDLITIELSDKLDIFDVIKMNVRVLNDTSLEINYSNKSESKIEINYFIESNIELTVHEFNQSKKIKIANNYYLNEFSKVKVNKFYETTNAREMSVVSLDGDNAKFDYSLKTIAKGEQKYDVFVYHNFPNTVSDIVNKGINLEDGSTIFNTTSIVPSSIKNCYVNQNSKIITFNNKKCSINPKLLIDEQDVIANHSALIGGFDDEVMFYLMSRGISSVDATKLLVKGFLNEENDELINNVLNKYWRYYE